MYRKLIIGSTGLAVAHSCYINRPVPSSRMYQDTLPVRQLPDAARDNSFLLNIGRAVVLTPLYLFARSLMKLTTNITIIDGHKLNEAVENRPPNQGLITISNHLSTVDDPAILALTLPLSTLFQPSKLRWTLCAEEYCCKNKFLASAFGAGKVLPVARGQGKDQPWLLNFADKLNIGGWCHIFPEGRIWQDMSSPERDDMGSLYSPSGRKAPPLTKLGPLKWGTAKMVTHATIPPVIIPVYHFGMEDMFPQNKKNKLESWLPKTGKTIYVKVGDPIKVDDLIMKHKETVMKAEAVAIRNGTYGCDTWKKFLEHEENILLVNITTRMQLALLKLEAELLEEREKTEVGFTHRAYFLRAKDRLRYLRDAAHSKADKAKQRARGAKERTKVRANLLKQHVRMAKDVAKDRMIHAKKIAKERKLVYLRTDKLPEAV